MNDAIKLIDKQGKEVKETNMTELESESDEDMPTEENNNE
jgi:hypothetical protein